MKKAIITLNGNRLYHLITTPYHLQSSNLSKILSTKF